MSFIGGYQSDVSLSNLNFAGDFPIDHLIGGFGTTTGINSYLLALTPPISQYRPGLPLEVRFSEANTGAVTINVSNKGAKAIKKIISGILVDLEAGDLTNDKVYILIYDGNVFQIANSSHLLLDASETRKGISQIATIEEVTEGENNSKLVTPAKLKAYIAGKVTGLWKDKGLINCGENPNYPAGQVGDAYTISVGGKIGGVVGQNVSIRDVLYCRANNNGGDEETVGYAWDILQANLEPATEIIAGYLRLATQAEVNAGGNNLTAVTPAKLKALLDGRLATEVLTGLIELATQAEVNAGQDDVRAVTSLKLMTLLNSLLKYQASTGANSIIPKLGLGNVSSGSFAAVLNGQNNRANGAYSSAVGLFADALIYNEWAKAGGGFYNIKGSSQNSILNLLNVIPANGGIYPVTPDGNGGGASNRWLPPVNCIQQFTAQFTVVQNSGSAGSTGQTWTGIYEGVVKNTNGVLSWLGGSPTLREVRQDAGFSPSLGFLIGGGEITAFINGMAERTLHASVTVYITQTKFALNLT